MKKSYISVLMLVAFTNCWAFMPNNQRNTSAYQDTVVYNVNVTTTGDDALVYAIQQLSTITEGDTNRWGFSWVPVVGASIRDGMIIKVRDFIRTCRGIEMARNYFVDQGALMAWFPTYKQVQICRALKNLDEQGEAAQALLGRFGTEGEKLFYRDELSRFIGNINRNRNLMAPVCGQIKQHKITKAARQLQVQRNELDANKMWWRINQVRWDMAKDIGTQAFKGAKWIAQTVNENSAPLLSAAAMWFVYDKMFGTRRPAAQ